ncbi:YceI family protein [Macrococcus armenti]|uniref:YceI family protein n=1 Tax=Macrococcus armenti TaxID=2875764 RepID=A0ABY3ZUD4_9STAP|nr:YceI family protein [Macrococcus armenti]UBH08616.1 YceI family protein [Macrococcus armenti]UBH10913.1 YceI family protein [Macrococcus armenti]UBH13139.1 YceI family protein [Macrococcus armenti]UBH15395.1 YceI family protein [Macrococcus armenti]UBH17752.1 YceI family protein [Macrococcus armenti]
MTNFQLDKAHSSIEFSIKHLMVSKVKGEFTEFDGEVTGDINDLSSLQIKGSVKVDSIDTNNADRDGHLKTGDFFDAATYPEIKFVSKSVSENKITGDLTIKDQTHEETFDLEFNGVHKNPMDGSSVTGFIINGTVNREKYGMNFNQALETGGVMLGKDVKFEVGTEFRIEE